MKAFLKVLVVLVAVVVLAGIFKDAIAKTAVQSGVQSLTGLKLRMKSLNVGLSNTRLGIQELKLHNPSNFPKDPVMVDMPEIYVDYKLSDILMGKIHLEEVRLNLKEVVIVKNEKGELNLDHLKQIGGKEKKAPTKAEPQAPEPSAPAKPKKTNLLIDQLDLKIGKVIYKDYSKGGAPKVQEFKVNVNQQHQNITDPNALVAIIVANALMNTTIANLANLDMEQVFSNLESTGVDLSKYGIDGLGEIAGQTGKIGKEAAGLLSDVKSKLGDLGESSKGLLDSLKKSGQ